jgi:hypothetical protein
MSTTDNSAKNDKDIVREVTYDGVVGRALLWLFQATIREGPSKIPKFSQNTLKIWKGIENNVWRLFNDK